MAKLDPEAVRRLEGHRKHGLTVSYTKLGEQHAIDKSVKERLARIRERRRKDASPEAE